MRIVIVLLFASFPLFANGGQEDLCSQRSGFETTATDINNLIHELQRLDLSDDSIVVVCIQLKSTVEQGLLNVKRPQIDTFELWKQPDKDSSYVYSLDRYRELKSMFGTWEQISGESPTVVPPVNNFNDLVRYSYQELQTVPYRHAADPSELLTPDISFGVFDKQQFGGGKVEF